MSFRKHSQSLDSQRKDWVNSLRRFFSTNYFNESFISWNKQPACNDNYEHTSLKRRVLSYHTSSLSFIFTFDNFYIFFSFYFTTLSYAHHIVRNPIDYDPIKGSHSENFHFRLSFKKRNLFFFPGSTLSPFHTFTHFPATSSWSFLHCWSFPTTMNQRGSNTYNNQEGLLLCFFCSGLGPFLASFSLKTG